MSARAASGAGVEGCLGAGVSGGGAEPCPPTRRGARAAAG